MRSWKLLILLVSFLNANELNLYKEACDEFESADGCYKLALMYKNGIEIKQDYDTANTYLEKACENKHATACVESGYLYFTGKTEQHYAKAMLLYDKGCQLGSAVGCHNYGLEYLNGKPVVEKDYKIAKDYMERSCQMDNKYGCSELGYLYEKGYSVEQNYNLAKKYYTMGCKSNDSYACSSLDILSKFLASENRKRKQTSAPNVTKFVNNIPKDYEKGQYDGYHALRVEEFRDIFSEIFNATTTMERAITRTGSLAGAIKGTCMKLTYVKGRSPNYIKGFEKGCLTKGNEIYQLSFKP